MFKYHVEPIVEGTAAGAALNAASTPEIAHLRYELNMERESNVALEQKVVELESFINSVENANIQSNISIALLEQQLAAQKEEFEKQASHFRTLEVNFKTLAKGQVHLIEKHLVPLEDSLREAAIALLPVIFGCGAPAYGGDGSFGTFEGVVRPANPSPPEPVIPSSPEVIIPLSPASTSSSSLSTPSCQENFVY